MQKDEKHRIKEKEQILFLKMVFADGNEEERCGDWEMKIGWQFEWKKKLE